MIIKSGVVRNLTRCPKLFLSSCPSSNPDTLDECKDNLYIEGEIIVRGDNVPPPLENFDSYEWPKFIKSYFNLKKFSKPTPIQAQGWATALAGRDLVGIAQTGSGKTLAYLLPALVHIRNRIKKNSTYKGPKALVILPTRELTQQSEKVCLEIGEYAPVSLYGGTSRSSQNSILQSTAPEIVFATPGRLNDFLDISAIKINDVGYLVLDEADRMLEMGFEQHIRRIIRKTDRTSRQTLMWSATWPEEVEGLAIEFLENFVQINIGTTEAQANPNIKQEIIFCDKQEKDQRLSDLIKKILEEETEQQYNRILIFAVQKAKVDYLTRYLSSHGLLALGLHGDKPQSSRTSIINSFREGDRRILVATDIAARGLDLCSVKHVINYDIPPVIEDYIHRIGRTGRQGKKGYSYAFFTLPDIRIAKDLTDILERNKQLVPAQLVDLAKRSNTEVNNKRKKFSRFSPQPYYNSQSGGPYTNFKRRFSSLTIIKAFKAHNAFNFNKNG